jgi:hypothetical protein
MRLLWLALAAVLLAGGAAADTGGPTLRGVGTALPATSSQFPIAVSANGRYLVDNTGAPFMMIADSAQGMMNLPLTDADGSCTNCSIDYYFSTRAAQGFNTIQFDIVCDAYPGGTTGVCTSAAGNNFYGQSPFSGTISSGSCPSGSWSMPCYNLTLPNTTSTSTGIVPTGGYWAKIDYIVRTLAPKYNLWLLLNPIETGSCDTPYSMQLYIANGVANATTFGTFLGNRYKNDANVAWHFANDYPCFTTVSSDNLIFQLATAIRNAEVAAPATSHLQTMEVSNGRFTTLDDTSHAWTSVVGGKTLIGINGVYVNNAPTFPAGAHGTVRAYGQTPTMPVIGIEYNYEEENIFGIECNGAQPPGPATCATQILRKPHWWTFTTGGIGVIYGDHFTWNFLSGWPTHLNLPGANQYAFIKTFLSQRAWHLLVPDTGNTFLTAGMGTACSEANTVTNCNFATAAKASDNSFGIAYVPLSTTTQVTINMTSLTGPRNAYWYDPTNNTISAPVAGSPFTAASHAIPLATANSEGTTDKVLLVQ